MTQEPNERIAEGYTNLLEGYFNKIDDLTESYKERVRAQFSAANNQTKRSMLDGLEQIIDNVEIALGGIPTKLPAGSSLIFDPQRAIQVRKAKGLTLQQLADAIGSNQAVLSRYETGGRYPNPKRAKNYLNWLVMNGYFSSEIPDKNKFK